MTNLYVGTDGTDRDRNCATLSQQRRPKKKEKSQKIALEQLVSNKKPAQKMHLSKFDSWLCSKQSKTILI